MYRQLRGGGQGTEVFGRHTAGLAIHSEDHDHSKVSVGLVLAA